jgi:tetratricopeptide (TPR) repeat protein
LLRSIPAPHERSAKFARNLAIVHNNLSYILRKHDPAGAERASREAIDILERLTTESAGRADYQDDLALCYNNRAALESQSRRWNEAIDWHERAIALQQEMTRKAPGVVRHRSELAVSLNNLGVAHCRAKQPADADAAFQRARDLLATLAHDYPDQLAYSSSWAALLNNQAMALAEANRHEDALEIYPAAIEAQSQCWQRMPDSMGEPLSKMYYNYGQSLQRTARFAAATDAALARRQIWQQNGQRLFGVAVELAQIASASRDANGDHGSQKADKLTEEIIKTLRAARQNGWYNQSSLATDERFAFLREDRRFEQLIADWDRPATTAKTPPDETHTPSTSVRN